LEAHEHLHRVFYKRRNYGAKLSTRLLLLKLALS